MTRLAMGVAAACLSVAVPAVADDAYSVRQSDTRVKLRLQLANGQAPKVTVFDGEMASVETGGRKIGLTPQVGQDQDNVLVHFWELTRHASGEESARKVGQATYTLGQPVAAPVEAVSGAIQGIEILSIARRKVDRAAATPRDAPGRK